MSKLSVMLVLSAVLAFFSCVSRADEVHQAIDFGVVSYHVDEKSHFNNTNLGLGYERSINDRWSVSAGFYRNSIRNTSYYVAPHYTIKKNFFLGADLGASVIVATGYHTPVLPIPEATLCWKYACAMTNVYVSSVGVRIPF